MGLSASRSINDRLRRRLALESDFNGPVTDVVKNISDDPAETDVATRDFTTDAGSLGEMNVAPTSLVLSLPDFIPSRLWKYWTLGGAALSALTGLLLAWLFAEEAADAARELWACVGAVPSVSQTSSTA